MARLPETLDSALATATGVAAVTPSDATAVAFRALYVGGTGNVAVECVDGTTGTFSSVPAGTTLFVGVVKVLSTGTTATNILGLK